MQKKIRTNNIKTVLLAVALLMLAATATADEQTPFVLDGYVSNSNGDPCNEPWVLVTNTNTSTSWDAVNSSTSNYYQLVLDSNDVSEGDVLEIDASGCLQSKIMLETVSQDKINNDGLFNYNITLVASDTTPPVISNVTNTELTTDSVTISWDTNEDSYSVVKYGTTPGNYLNEQSDTSLVSSHSISLTGLSANTTYYYVVNSTDTSDNAGESSEFSFITAAIADTTPPVISNVTNTEPTTDSVTISWDTNEDSYSVVKYGTTPGNYLNEQSDTSLVSLHSISLTGLSANTTYYYVVNSTDASDNAGESSEYNFTTAAIADTTPPIISNVTNTDPTTDSVTISWITNEDSDSVVKYGTTPGNYLNEQSDTSLVSSHSISLTGLSANTTYYYVVNSTDTSDNAGESSEYNFTTAAIADTTPPVISNVTNTEPTTDSVTISWDTNEDSYSVVKYGTTPGNYLNEQSDTSLVSSHSISLTGLNATTTYYYVVNCTDASDNAGESSEYNFTTAAIPDTTILIGDAIAAPNSYALISIMVNNVSDLGSGSINVTYNSSVVHVTNVTSGDGNALVVQGWNVDNSTGLVQIFAQDANESYNGDVVFANVTFHALGEYPDSTPLAISFSELIDYTNYGIIGHCVTNGTFSMIENEPPVITDAIATSDVILSDNGRPRIAGTNVTVLNATVLDIGSGVVNVTINLSSIGGSDDQVMERVADTDIWTVATTATDGINLSHELVVTATDASNNTNTSVIGLTVLLRGDIVRDGDLNSADAFYISKYLIRKEPIPSLLVSDMSPAEGDGRVTSADALYLAKYLVGKEIAP